METTIKFKVKPFEVPKTVALYGPKELSHMPDYPAPPMPCHPGPVSEFHGLYSLSNVKLSMLSNNELIKMCSDFTNSVFIEAGKCMTVDESNIVEVVPEELKESLAAAIRLIDVLVKDFEREVGGPSDNSAVEHLQDKLRKWL